EGSEVEERLKQPRSRLLPGRGGTLGAAALQERTNSLAAEKGITVQSTQVMKEEAVDPYRKVSVRLTLSGELKPFAELLSGLEYDQQLAVPFVEANRRGAVPGAKGPRTIQATGEVTGFVLGEEAKEAKRERRGRALTPWKRRRMARRRPLHRPRGPRRPWRAPAGLPRERLPLRRPRARRRRVRSRRSRRPRESPPRRLPARRGR